MKVTHRECIYTHTASCVRSLLGRATKHVGVLVQNEDYVKSSNTHISL